MVDAGKLGNALVVVNVAVRRLRLIVFVICISILCRIVPTRSVLFTRRSQQEIHSEQQVESSFIHGYSGILLGLILLDTPPNQSIVKSALQSEPEAMENLVQAMEEFATMHEKEDREQAGLEPADSGVDEEEVQSEVAGKIRLMLKQLRSL